LLAMTMNRMEEASGYFNEVVKRSRNFPGVHHHLGVLYQMSDNIGKAFSEYFKEIALTNNPDTHYNLGLLYLEHKKNFKKAKSHFQAVLLVRPEDEEVKLRLQGIEKELRGE